MTEISPKIFHDTDGVGSQGRHLQNTMLLGYEWVIGCVHTEFLKIIERARFAILPNITLFPCDWNDKPCILKVRKVIFDLVFDKSALCYHWQSHTVWTKVQKTYSADLIQNVAGTWTEMKNLIGNVRDQTLHRRPNNECPEQPVEIGESKQPVLNLTLSDASCRP